MAYGLEFMSGMPMKWKQQSAGVRGHAFEKSFRSKSRFHFSSSKGTTKHSSGKRLFVKMESGSDKPSVTLPLYSEDESVDSIVFSKMSLLEKVAGSDRGGALFSNAQREEIGNAVDQLCKVAKNSVRQEDVMGRWRLVYTSNTLDQSGPGPKIGQVYQKIEENTVDNIVEVMLPVFSNVLIILAHKLRILEEGDTYEITFKETKVSVAGNELQLPSLDLPDALRPLRSASFKNIYADDSLRVSKGDRGELRIYVSA